MNTATVVIVGGSISGLAAAAAVAPLVGQVLVVERADVDAVGGSVAPQGQLPHILCVAGAAVLEDLLPGFAAALLAQGAAPGGRDRDGLPVYWHAAGVVRRRLAIPNPGFPRALCGRRLIEPELRRRVAALPNVRLLPGTAQRGIWEQTRLAGVVLKDGTRLPAELVIDATGRAGTFRTALDIRGVPTTEVGVDLRYTGFVVERQPGDASGAGAELLMVQNTRTLARIGAALPLDSQRWHVILGGYFGDAVAPDPAAAAAFARSLADPVLVPLLQRPFLEEPRRYTFRSSQRIHWEQLPRQIAGYIPLGDAVASFNPIYGQGMSSALLQARALAALMRTHGLGPDTGLERAAAHQFARIVQAPWTVATGADSVYAQTTGARPRGHALVNRYIERVMQRAAVDETVNLALTGVQQMLAGPQSLFAPSVVGRVLRPQGEGGAGGRDRDTVAPVVAASR